jgi:poly(A) polymerase
MDNASLAAMDGPRLNQFNKSQIKPSNVRLFQVSLQCIKYWAIQRGLYNAEIGYLNETACTLLLIKSFMFIQSKENLSIIIILQNFFQMWSKWPWKTPVILTDHITDKNGNKLEYNSITGSQKAMMPIISPCYPVYNVTPYVTKLTQKTIQLEFERGNHNHTVAL